MNSKSSKDEESELVYLGDFPMAPSRMIVRFKCASSRYFSLAEDPLEERKMMRTPFSALQFRQKVPSRNRKLKKKGPYPRHRGSSNPFRKENTRRWDRQEDAFSGIGIRGNGSRRLDIRGTGLMDVAIKMKELEAWRFEFCEDNKNKKIDRTRSVSPFSQEPGTSRVPTIEDQSHSDSTAKESYHKCQDTLLSKNRLLFG